MSAPPTLLSLLSFLSFCPYLPYSCLTVLLCVCLNVQLLSHSISVCRLVCLSHSQSVCPSNCQAFCQPVCQHVCLTVSLYVCLTLTLSVSLETAGNSETIAFPDLQLHLQPGLLWEVLPHRYVCVCILPGGIGMGRG